MTGSRVLCKSPRLLIATVAAIIAATHWYGLPGAAAQARPGDNAGERTEGETDRGPVREDIVLRESIDVRLISRDAVVTDSSDRPVTGLTRDDFELKVEGEPVEFGWEENSHGMDVEIGRAAGGQYIAVRSGLLLGPGSYRLAVGLWEENSGRSSFVVRKLSVQPDPSVA